MKAIVVFAAILCLAVVASATHAHRRNWRRNIIDSDSAPKTGGAPAPAPTGAMGKSVDRKWPNFELKPTTDGQFHVVLKAGNSETIVTSETLKQKASARNTIRAIVRASFNPKAIETKKSADGQFMFNLKGGNNEIVGTSETYKDEAGLKKGIAAVTKASIGFLLKFIRAAETNKQPGKPSVKHFPGKDGAKFYAHIKAANNEIILNTANPSDSADAAFEVLAEIIGHSLAGKDIKWNDVEQKESNSKQGFRGLLLNAEGKEIARTEVYTDKAGLQRFKEETLPKNVRALFNAYWKDVVEQKDLQDVTDDDGGAPSTPSASAPTAPSPSQQKKAGAEEEEEF